MQLARACIIKKHWISSELTRTKNGSNRQLPADGQDRGHEQGRKISGGRASVHSCRTPVATSKDVLVIALNEFLPFLLMCMLL